MSVLIAPAAADEKAARARAFWAAFTGPTSRPRLVFGRNVYTESLVRTGHVDAVIDDFAADATFAGRPILRSRDAPKDALVIAAAGGRPLTVRRMLDALELEHLDYFALVKHAAPELREIVFNEGFLEEFQTNRAAFEWAHGLLADETSRETFRRLVSFRHSYDLDVLEGFTDRQKEQYFEDFLQLRREGETFVDVGCFDGCTTLEFIKRCPDYRGVFAFEPDPGNHAACLAAIGALRDVVVFPFGAGRERATYRFTVDGSASTITESGEIEIAVDRIDDVLAVAPTFIKIDTEGAEADALEGARATIAAHAPTLAVSVYHKPKDFWAIPRLVLGMRDDYCVFLRHYTESIYETVMFFVRRDA